MRAATKASHAECVALSQALEKTTESLDKVSSELQEKQDQMQVLEAELVELESAHAHLLGEYDSLNSTMEALKTEFETERSESKATILQAQAELELKRAEINGLSTELARAKEAHDDLSAQKRELERTASVQVTEIANLTSLLESEKRARAQELENLSEQLKVKEERLQTVLSQLRQADTTSTTLQNELASLQILFDETKSSLEASLTEEKAQHAKDVEALEARVAALSADSNSVHQLFESSIETINLLKAETEAKSAQIASLTAEKNYIEASLASEKQLREEERAHLNEVISVKDKELHRSSEMAYLLTQDIAELKSQLKLSEEEVARKIDEIGVTVVERDELKVELNNLATDLESVKGDLDTALAQLGATIKEKEEIYATLTQERKKHQEDVERMLLVINSKDEAIAKLNHRTSSERDELKSEVEALTEQVKMLQADLDDLHSKLSISVQEKATLEAAYQAKIEETRVLEADWNSTRDSLSKQIAVLEKSNESLGSQNSELSRRLEKTCEDLASLQSDFEAERTALREALELARTELNVARSQLDKETEIQLQNLEAAVADSKRLAAERDELKYALDTLSAEKSELAVLLQQAKEESSARLMLASVDIENLQHENSKLSHAVQQLQNEASVALEKFNTSSSEFKMLKRCPAPLDLPSHP